jgi:hypothetical protein
MNTKGTSYLLAHVCHRPRNVLNFHEITAEMGNIKLKIEFKEQNLS